MSVDRTDYVIYGVDVGYDNVSWEKFEPELHGSPDARFDLIYDGMNGEYAYAGKIIAVADSYDGFGKGVNLEWKDEGPMVTMMAVMSAFPELKLGMRDFKMIVMSHFS